MGNAVDQEDLDEEMNKTDILKWLKEQDVRELEKLWDTSETVRAQNVGDAVHLRGLVEISNHCIYGCTYCGIRSANKGISRYRMTEAEILSTVDAIEAAGLGTVVFQSGEDPGIETDFITRIVSRIKERTDLAVALCLGERTRDDLAVWRRAGADRYLLKFETSDRDLYRAIHLHPPGGGSDRFEILEYLRELGYEIGSGIMIGIPGQTYHSIADDLILFKKFDLDMIAVGPYIPHPDTPLGSGRQKRGIPEGEQAPDTERMVRKVLALTRIVCPQANIPSTSALSILSGGMRGVGLSCGANVVMPNLTPMRYRHKYNIYPGKSSRTGADDDDLKRIIGEISAMGREVGRGPGDRMHT